MAIYIKDEKTGALILQRADRTLAEIEANSAPVEPVNETAGSKKTNVSALKSNKE